MSSNSGAIAKQSRVPNFTVSEKLHLMRLIAEKHARVIEDKKTDRASAEKKENSWSQITDEFNATSSTGIKRTAACLKKCYENRKKQLRKTLAEEKKEIQLTGGGPPPKVLTNEVDDILMSILNKKTLVGLQNNFDNDAETSLPISLSHNNADVEFILEEGNHQENYAVDEPDNMQLDLVSYFYILFLALFRI